MALTYKILGQDLCQGVIGTAEVVAGPVGVGKSWVVSTIVICNQGGTAATYRLSISHTTTPTGAEYIVFGSTVPANDTVTLTLGITMQEGKYILGSASSASVSMSAFGTEIS